MQGELRVFFDRLWHHVEQDKPFKEFQVRGDHNGEYKASHFDPLGYSSGERMAPRASPNEVAQALVLSNVQGDASFHVLFCEL